ncbi:tRNA lysidine(34) synthetase TilS [Granulicatella sp.]
MKEVETFLMKFVPNWKQESFLLAVSGGVDSMVLLESFFLLQKKIEALNFSVVHIHHHLRKESDEEEEMVREYCMIRNISLEVHHWQQGASQTVGVEEKARKFRYQKLEESMKKNKARYVVVAHHADDQVETVLMKLTRGSTLEGIAGMKPIRPFSEGYLIRPFLTVDKEELYEYALIHQIPYQEDMSNQSLEYTRNRFRKEIIPLFKQENPKFNQKIQEFTQTLQEQQELILTLAHQWIAQELVELSGGWSWEKEIYLKQPVGLQKVILVEISKKLGGLLSTKNVSDIQKAIVSDTSQMSLNLPKGWIFQKRYDQLLIIKEEEKDIPYQEIRVEGIQSEDIVLSKDERISFKTEQGWEMFVSSEDFPLTIRRRKPDDQFLLKENQHQSVRRWCINQKISRELREKLWIVENSSKEIIAILGFRQTQSLSKREETDRIRIVYRNKEEVLTC